jgi:hypothetical protein
VSRHAVRHEAQGWAIQLDDLVAWIAPRFRRIEPRRRARAYLQGLLSPLGRKNGWHLAEAADDASPDGVQDFLARMQAETRLRIQTQLDAAEREFDEGRVLAPVSGIVSTRIARPGETVPVGSSIAEIYRSGDLFIDWYIPSFRLEDPLPGQRVSVMSGKTWMSGRIDEILPISGAFDAKRTSTLREPPGGQVARIRLEPGARPPSLNGTVVVHMYYLEAVGQVAGRVAALLGLAGREL